MLSDSHCFRIIFFSKAIFIWSIEIYFVFLHRRLRECADDKKKLNCLTNYHLEVD